MNSHLERGRLLYQQSRYEMAETELRQALAHEPDEPFGHALLALCLAERKQYKAATEEAQLAVHHGPDFDFAHYAIAKVFYDRNCFKEALQCVNEAIRLDPTPVYFGLLSAIHLEERRWKEALEAAEQGLQLDAEDEACTNLRAMALVKLGRKTDAGASIDATLSKRPESSTTHANKGWTLLEEGNYQKALEHFREALRLDPENEWARQGIVEALKAKHFIYAWMLRYFLWMSKLSKQAQWAVVLGGYFGIKILGGVARANPELAPWILPIQIIYVIFAILTWTADPLFNLLLRMNRFGRLALSRQQMVASNWFGATVLLAILSLPAWIVSSNQAFLFSALVFGFLTLPVAGTFKCHHGWPRTVMAVYTAALAGIGLLGAGMGKKGIELMGLFLLGIFLSAWIVNFLVHARPRR